MATVIFVYIGAYSTIAGLWRAAEIMKDGEAKPNVRDTLIALVAALPITMLIC